MSAVLLAAADWFEILAALIFLIITGLSQLLQKRAARRRAEQMGSPDPEMSTGPLVQDADEELRRIFERYAPPPPTEPPRLPASPPPPHPPASWTVATPHDESFSWEDRDRPSAESAASLEDRDREPTPAAGDPGGYRFHPGTKVGHAAEANRHALHLQQVIADRLQGPHAPPAARKDPGSLTLRTKAAADLHAVLRNPRSLRQAIVAATVLQPPKALEDRPL